MIIFKSRFIIRGRHHLAFRSRSKAQPNGNKNKICVKIENPLHQFSNHKYENLFCHLRQKCVFSHQSYCFRFKFTEIFHLKWQNKSHILLKYVSATRQNHQVSLFNSEMIKQISFWTYHNSLLLVLIPDPYTNYFSVHYNVL